MFSQDCSMEENSMRDRLACHLIPCRWSPFHFPATSAIKS